MFAAFSELGICKDKAMRIRAISGEFPTHGSTGELYADLGLTAMQMAAEAEGLVNSLAH